MRSTHAPDHSFVGSTLQRFRPVIFFFLLAGICTPSPAADNTWTNAAGSLVGTWETASRWSLGVSPGTVNHTNDTVVLDVNRSGALNGTNVLTLNNASLSALGLAAMTVRNINGAFLLAPKILLLDVDGTAGTPLKLNIGDPSSNPVDAIILRGDSVALDLNWVEMNFLGTPSDQGIETVRRNAAINAINAVDSSITMSTVASGKGILLSTEPNLGGNAAIMEMLRGSLTVTNAAGNALIQLGSGSAAGGTTAANSRLKLQDTSLKANGVSVQYTSTFTFDNGGAYSGGTPPPASKISGILTAMGGATVNLVAGSLTIGAITGPVTTDPNLPLRYNVAGATVNVLGDILFRGGAQGTNSPFELNVSGGILDADGDIYVATGSARPTNAELCSLNVSSSGTLFAAKSIYLGRAPTSDGNRGSGTMTVSGGRFEMNGANWTNILQVGTHAAGTGGTASGRGNGCYFQTGGTSIVGTVKLLMTMTNYFANDSAAEAFVVSGGSSMTIRGPGFQKVIGAGGGGVWRLGDQPGDLDFSGTLVFDPAPTIVAQSLLAFGNDMGRVFEGLTATNYHVGKLDLTALDGAEALTVTNSGLYATGALYVRALTGLTPAEVPTRLKSAINIYYDPFYSPELANSKVDLTGGGKLQPIPRNGTVFRFR